MTAERTTGQHGAASGGLALPRYERPDRSAPAARLARSTGSSLLRAPAQPPVAAAAVADRGDRAAARARSG